jgi:hypothetical protein
MVSDERALAIRDLQLLRGRLARRARPPREELNLLDLVILRLERYGDSSGRQSGFLTETTIAQL